MNEAQKWSELEALPALLSVLKTQQSIYMNINAVGVVFARRSCSKAGRLGRARWD